MVDIVREIDKALKDLKAVTGTKEGRAFVWWLISICGVYNSVFSEYGNMCRAEGKREIGLILIDKLNQIDPNLIYNIAKEQNNA